MIPGVKPKPKADPDEVCPACGFTNIQVLVNNGRKCCNRHCLAVWTKQPVEQKVSDAPWVAAA